MSNYPWGLDSYTQYIKTWDFDEKADKMVKRTVPDPKLTDTWYEDNDHTTLSLTSQNPPTWTATKSGQTFTLTFEDDTWTYNMAGAATYDISGTIDDLIIKYPVSWGYLTITRNYGTKTVQAYVVYTDEVYTKSEVDAIIQKLKDDNHLV